MMISRLGFISRTTKLMLLIGFSTLYYSSIFSQHQDSLVLSKGRFITSLNGTLTNQEVGGVNFSDAKNSGYRIGTKSGYFFKDKWVLGANLSLNRREVENTQSLSNYEEFSLGAWTRFYSGRPRVNSGVVFLELTPFYVSVFQQDEVFAGTGNPLLQEVTGNGFGIEPGFGFAYVLNRNVGFGISVSYRYAELGIETEDLILETVEKNNITLNELLFSFEFQIYLNDFFF